VYAGRRAEQTQAGARGPDREGPVGAAEANDRITLVGGKKVTMTIEVNIVPDRVHFPMNDANVAGRYIHPGLIWVESTRLDNGQITVDPYILGHELLHALNYRDGSIQNPDETTIWQHESK